MYESNTISSYVWLYLFFTIPFIIPHTIQQWPTLLPELAAFGFGILYTLGKRNTWRSWGALQWSIVTYGLCYRSLLPAVYCTWAAYLTCQEAQDDGRRYRQEDALAWALLLGSTLIAWSGFIQYLSLEFPFRIFTLTPYEGMVGFLGQRNLFANVIACGLLSLCHLHKEGQLKCYLSVLLLSLFLASALAFSGSRSAWVYLLLLLILYPTRVSVTMLLAFASVRYWPSEQPIVTRNLTEAISESPRWILAKHAYLLWKDSVVLGGGFGSFKTSMIAMASQYHGMIDRHAHNIILQTAAEAGMVGLAAILWMIYQIHRSLAFDRFMLGLVSIQAFHSLVEFPLWDARFLGLTAIALSTFRRK